MVSGAAVGEKSGAIMDSIGLSAEGGTKGVGVAVGAAVQAASAQLDSRIRYMNQRYMDIL